MWEGLRVQSIAHIRESDGQIQTVEEHLHEVRKLAESYGVKLHMAYPVEYKRGKPKKDDADIL